MSEKELRETCTRIVCENIGTHPDQVNDAASLRDDLGADSLDCVELLMSIEEAFGIAIPDEDMEGADTFGDMIEYLKKRLSIS